MPSYYENKSFCPNCRKFLLGTENVWCPVCGTRMKHKPFKKKSNRNDGVKVLNVDGVYRCGNCKVRLVDMVDRYVCTNEFCGMVFIKKGLEVVAVE